jgi:hypothetical protein
MINFRPLSEEKIGFQLNKVDVPNFNTMTIWTFVLEWYICS